MVFLFLNKFRKLSLDDKLGILLFLGSFIFVGIMFWACFKPSLWSDESFSLLLIQESYFGIIVNTMADVHPPLYYFILKFFVSLFQIFNLTPDSTIAIARFASIIPFILLLVLDFFKVRDNWGWLCCGVFAVCLISMPQMMYYSTDIRMYSWALFFVTVCFIYAYDIISNPNVKNWIILSLSGVCAAYTHYFAAVSVMFIFLLLLVYFVFYDKIEIKKWVISVLFSFSLYLFWLFIVINQLTHVIHNYWIEPLSFNVLFEYLWFIFSPSSIFSPSIEIMGILLFFSYCLLFVYYFLGCKSDIGEHFILGGFFTLILTVLFGVIVSILIKPVFFRRYLFPSLGVFWLTFAVLLSKSWDYKKIFTPILICVLVVSCMASMTFIDLQIFANDVYSDLDSFIKQDSIKNDVFVVDVDNDNYLMYEYYTIKYLLKNYHGVLLNNTKYSDYVYSNLKNNKTIWLFSSEDFSFILQNCTKNNLTMEKYLIYSGVSQNGVFVDCPYIIYRVST